MKPTLMRRGAFTLIELLTVIAIIAILASMIFPSFSRAREMARRSSCASNMKQLGLGFMQYTQDYDGRMPGAGQFQRWGAGRGHWVALTNDVKLADDSSPYAVTNNKALVEQGALYTYVKSSQIYICPSNVDGPVKGMSYSMNCAIGGAPLDLSVQSPTAVIMLVDEEHANDGMFYTGTGSTDHATKIHNDTFNVLYCDGHVKATPFARFPIGNGSIAAKTSTTSEPRFYDTAGAGAQDFGFGSCESPAPAAAATPTPTPTP